MEGGTYLADFQAVIDLVLERSHLNFPDELRLNNRLDHDKGDQFAQVRQDQVRFVVGGRVQRRHSYAADLHIRGFEYGKQHLDQDRFQHGIESLIAVGEGVTQSLDSNSAVGGGRAL